MRHFLYFVVLMVAPALGQKTLVSHTTEDLRGVSAVSEQIAWASGTHGTFLRTTDGHIWQSGQVPDATALDFRGVVAFSADEAFLMSAGPGEQSRIYHTNDGGDHWQLQFTNSNPKGFFDAIVFWDPTHGMVLGDPIPDESGKLKFELLLTEDGQNWHPIPASQLPPAMEGEGAFAASNSCLAILPPGNDTPGSNKPGNDKQIWFATGGRVARVFHSPDRGHSWEVFDTPMVHGPESAGIFSIAFRDAMHGVIAGGDYKHPNEDGPNLAFTSDGGKTWRLATLHPQVYFSAAMYDRKEKGTEGNLTRLFLVAHDFVLEFRDYNFLEIPRRFDPNKEFKAAFNAAGAAPGGGGLFVGPKGAMIALP